MAVPASVVTKERGRRARADSDPVTSPHIALQKSASATGKSCSGCRFLQRIRTVPAIGAPADSLLSDGTHRPQPCGVMRHPQTAQHRRGRRASCRHHVGMWPNDPSSLRIVRRREQLDLANDRRRRRSVSSGVWCRVAVGSYARTVEWQALRPIEQHRVRVDEALRRIEPGGVISHRAAAAYHDVDVLGAWPQAVDVTVDHASGGRSTGSIRRHATGLAGVQREPLGAHEVTTPAQTALDLARTLPFVTAVTAVDQAIWRGRHRGALTTLAEIAELLDAHPRRGDAKARRVLSFANPESSNVRESQNFVVVVSLGFPRPAVQYRRVLRSGRLAIADLYIEELDHWCEIDGHGKYLSPEFGADRDPAEIVIDEKNRENEIRREVRGFSRWEATDADRPRIVYDILTQDGVRSSKPRP